MLSNSARFRRIEQTANGNGPPSRVVAARPSLGSRDPEPFACARLHFLTEPQPPDFELLGSLVKRAI